MGVVAVLDRVLEEDHSKSVIFEQRFGGVRDRTLQRSGRSTFQAKETANTCLETRFALLLKISGLLSLWLRALSLQ